MPQHDKDGNTATVVSSPFAIPQEAGRADMLAWVLSYVFNPFCMPPLTLIIVLAHFGASWGEVVWIGTVAVVFFCLVPLAVILRMVKRGEVSSLDVRERSRRIRPLIFGTASCAAAMLLVGLTATTAAALLVVLMLCHVANTVLITLITKRWKISLHMIGIGGFIAMISFLSLHAWPGLPSPATMGMLLSPVSFTFFLILVPALMWSRVQLGIHTVPQVVGGTMFGLLLPYFELYLAASVLLRIFS